MEHVMDNVKDWESINLINENERSKEVIFTNNLHLQIIKNAWIPRSIP